MQIPAPTHPTCSHLYRYQSLHLERIKTIILEHELSLPSVNQLNDPVDCRPKLAQLTVEEMETFMLNGYVLSILGNHLMSWRSKLQLSVSTFRNMDWSGACAKAQKY